MRQAVIVDIWGGDCSRDHVARFVRPIDEAIEIARVELLRGYLVNLRADAEFGPDGDFDDRRRAN